MLDLYIGESGLSLERVSDFDAVSLTANFGGFVVGRAVAGRHSDTDAIRQAGQHANAIDEVGIVTGNFDALVVPKARFEEQFSAEWAERIAGDLLDAAAAVEAKTLWMTHFMHFRLSDMALAHIRGILAAFSEVSTEEMALRKVLIDLPEEGLEPGADLRNAIEEDGWSLEAETQFFLESTYRLKRA